MLVENSITKDEFQKLKLGDRVVFKKVYDQYFALVRFVVNRCGVENDENLDLVQETFIMFYQKSVQIKDIDAIKAWLMTTAKNLAIDYIRRQKMANQHLYNLQEQGKDNHPSPYQDSENDPLKDDDNGCLKKEAYSAEHRELEDRLVRELIQRVDMETDDDTFSLFYSNGLAAKEIAKLKGESISTITTRLSRLRKRFHHVFVQHLNELRETA